MHSGTRIMMNKACFPSLSYKKRRVVSLYGMLRVGVEEKKKEEGDENKTKKVKKRPSVDVVAAVVVCCQFRGSSTYRVFVGLIVQFISFFLLGGWRSSSSVPAGSSFHPFHIIVQFSRWGTSKWEENDEVSFYPFPCLSQLLLSFMKKTSRCVYEMPDRS